jgi:hypothetical protein
MMADNRQPDDARNYPLQMLLGLKNQLVGSIVACPSCWEH